METLFNGFTLDIPAGCFPLSTDSILLADFAGLPRNARVLDLGSGCGTLGILLCAKDAACQVTGIELDEHAHESAHNNIFRNNLSGRMKSICADLRILPSLFPSGSFDCCISNPPYFSGGLPSKSLPLARQELRCCPEELFAAAAWGLKYGGDFFLVQKPQRLSELCVLAAAHHMEPKRLRLVRHRRDGEVSLILLACRKGGKPGLQWEEICLFEPDGSPTESYRTLYHL